jgi:uncharacterized protein YgiB involved in biofilm formation
MKKHGLAVMFGVFLAFMGLALALGIAHRGPAHAIVLVTVDDCRRSFDDTECRAIVERAQSIHADTAPSFERREMCELVYGAGACGVVKIGIIEFNRFAPSITAIAVTRDRDGIVPLYYGRQDDASGGRAVYYRNAVVGRLMLQKVGGADAPFIADRAGAALTAETVRLLHGR